MAAKSNRLIKPMNFYPQNNFFLKTRDSHKVSHDHNFSVLQIRDSTTLIDYPYIEMKSSASLLPSPKIMHKRLALSSS